MWATTSNNNQVSCCVFSQREMSLIIYDHSYIRLDEPFTIRTIEIYMASLKIINNNDHKWN